MDLPGVAVPDRVVAAVVPERQAPGAGAGGLAEQLVTQADAEDGDTRPEQLAHHVHLGGEQGGVAGAVRQQDAIGVPLEQRGRGGGGRHHHQLGAAAAERAQDVALEAVIDDRHPPPGEVGLDRVHVDRGEALIPAVGRLAGGEADEVLGLDGRHSPARATSASVSAREAARRGS